MASGHGLVFLALKFPEPVPDGWVLGGTVPCQDGGQDLTGPGLLLWA